MCLSIITLKINGLNTPTERHKVAEWIRKQDQYIGCLQDTCLRLKDTQTQIKRMEKDISCKWKGKKSWSSSTYIQQNRL